MYGVPYSCGNVYIGVITRRLEERVEEYQDACKRGDKKVSAIAELFGRTSPHFMTSDNKFDSKHARQ